jgi:hypothetical protein
VENRIILHSCFFPAWLKAVNCSHFIVTKDFRREY